MIKAHQQFDLWGKRVLERAVIQSPFRLFAPMPNEACFYYIKSGKNRVITEGETFDLQSKEGLVLKCGDYFSDYLANNNEEECEAFAVHFDKDVLKMIYENEFSDLLLDVKKVTPYKNQKIEINAVLKTYIDSLQFYFDNPELVSDELVKLKVKEIILLLARTDDAKAIHDLILGLFTPVETSFRELIEANIFNNLSLDELAKLARLSLSSFKREFAKHYNTTPAKYIKKKKLKQAAKLLQTTTLRISDITFESGFSDLAHFSKSFQKEYNCSPTQYRTKNQIQNPFE